MMMDTFSENRFHFQLGFIKKTSNKIIANATLNSQPLIVQGTKYY